MNLDKIIAGDNIPNDIYVIIEIPSNSSPIKYEMDKKSGMLFVDRFISTPMFYPCNYGYINQTLSSDGDPLDALVPSYYPIQSNCVIHCKPIGMLKMHDESGEDAKIIAVPNSKICKEYETINDISDLSTLLKKQISHFFQNYKKLEKEKWVKIIGWGNQTDAKLEISTSYNRAKKIHGT
ncbi:inorganic diphosphatase [Buchnera aphidicola]|uniref:Inorganic pyrophosphatase n=1 Tax=Buchnera aphidicola str. USDA (Myzus persicae) TaxID=1009856 RepID=W0P4I8_BUCMP|nr:inorganic diphosphatase [Buchnera aphidicola]AHG60280.1 Ppa [Buchnera aphidicola str. USDA (Myzus persicae)]AHG60858.1 Ppa [Buchnera aphidicola str. W106 (Myzus persicae)]AHG61430.1 Ppa [Buchnera aphidicola str. G002 (Myzus persicae)]AHG62003.1 Ppa [Buchnera aphidicola str. F009 (Myzus persicae)]WAI03033.1 MAG: inorganic diphosphatase [Buchnera aphidicola (Myzus persicae)]